MSSNFGQNLKMSSIDKARLGWPAINAPKMNLPDGVTMEALIEKHSTGNLMKIFDVKMPTQYAAHRGIIGFPEAPDNSMAAFHAAGKRGFRIIEMDITKLKPHADTPPSFVVGHDRKATRVLHDMPKRWTEYDEDDVVGQPMVVPQVKDGKFTEQYWLTEEKVCLAFSSGVVLLTLFRCIPYGRLRAS